MTEVEKIYSELENSDIAVVNMTFGKVSAVSVCDYSGKRAIVVDEKKFQSSEELKSTLLHEQGHCETYAFYGVYTSNTVRSKREYRADKYVAENKITKHMIDSVHKKEGYTESWEFAEHFGVTNDYMKRLMNINLGIEFMD
jgi:hypothetical protein